jgi:NAD(P)-dependent dehydrogenase (short-subunit alcohol dehydrogenase family)
MEARFDKKVVIITAGGAGMGKAAALGFAKEGAYVCINDIDVTRLNDTANEIKAVGGVVTTMAGDAMKIETVKNTVDKVLEKYGKVDILFNYVGGIPSSVQLFRESLIVETDELWDAYIELNLKTTMRFSRAVLDSMIKQKYGKIINTASIFGKVGQRRKGGVAYSAAKGGIIAFTRTLAGALAEYNINVNCVCPNVTETPTMKKKIGVQQSSAILALTPLGRLGRSEDVANAVLFLASDNASYITGQALSVDGGYTMV